MIVFRFAPVLQTLSKGTRSPKIVRPLIAGLEYSSVISVNPTFCSIFPSGLGCGASTCANPANPVQSIKANANNLFMCSSLNFNKDKFIQLTKSISNQDRIIYNTQIYILFNCLYFTLNNFACNFTKNTI